MGIIHRDIKPENVLVDGPEGNLRITDLNAALLVLALPFAGPLDRAIARLVPPSPEAAGPVSVLDRSVLDRPRLHKDVWGYDFDPGTNVADVFVGYLRRKLEAGGEPRILHTVRGVGFVLRP